MPFILRAIQRFSRPRLPLFLSACLLSAAPYPAPADSADKQGLKPILLYIASAWDTLTRSMTDCQSVVDPKLSQASVRYLPAGFREPATVDLMTGKCNVRVEHLPQEIHRLGDMSNGDIEPPGLLYLPDKYVVPGGRFN